MHFDALLLAEITMNPRRTRSSIDRRSECERRASFAQINASWAIEGQLMDAADLMLQEQLIRGELTHEQAIDEVKRCYPVERASADRSESDRQRRAIQIDAASPTKHPFTLILPTLRASPRRGGGFPLFLSHLMPVPGVTQSRASLWLRYRKAVTRRAGRCVTLCYSGKSWLGGVIGWLIERLRQLPRS